MYNEIFEPIVLLDVIVNDANTFTATVDPIDLPSKVRASLGIGQYDSNAQVFVHGDFDMTLEDEGRSPSVMVIDKNFVVSYGNVDILMSFTQFNMGELERDLVQGWDWQHEWDRQMEAALEDAADRAWED